MPETITPQDFASDQPPDRIFGTEMEYDAPSLVQLLEELGPEQKTSYLQALAQYDIKASFSSPAWLSNGMRVDTDMGHLEVASAETRGPRQAAINDHAGAELVSALNRLILDERAIDPRKAQLYTPQRRSGVQGYGSNAKEYGNYAPEYFSKGYHENFLLPAELTFRQGALLQSFLVTRGLPFGAGQVGNIFMPAQKLVATQRFIDDAETQTTEYNKPLGRHHYEKNTGWTRLEVRSGDPHMHPEFTFRSMATLSLVLRICEHWHLFTDEQIDAATVILSTKATLLPNYGLNLLMNDRLRLNNFGGSSVTALTVQQRLCELAQILSAMIELPQDEHQALIKWQDTLDALSLASETKDFSRLASRVEWAAKLHHIVERTSYDPYRIYTSAAQFPWEALALDYKWTSLDARRLGKSVITKCISEDFFYDGLIQRRVSLPPTETRASIRGRIAEIASSTAEVTIHNWHTYQQKYYEPQIIGPYETL